jgi:uncharacterized membrane protein (DUF106 family)
MNYGKKIIAFLFLVTFFSQIMSKQFVAVDYLLNTSKYAKNCINKSKPKMNCKGKCQAMKKIQEQEKQEQQNQEKKSENEYSVLSSKSFPPVIPSYYQNKIEKKYCKLTSPKTKDFSFDFFRPPSFSSLA